MGPTELSKCNKGLHKSQCWLEKKSNWLNWSAADGLAKEQTEIWRRLGSLILTV